MNHMKLEDSWQKLVKRHEMLRAIVFEDGMQQVLDKVPTYKFDILDLRESPCEIVEAELQSIRNQMNRGKKEIDEWPLFDIRLTKIDGVRSRLHFAVDMIVVDTESTAILLEEWRQLYENIETELRPIDFTFKEYIRLHELSHDSLEYARAEDYWTSRLESIPSAPQLPLVTDQPTQTLSDYQYQCKVFDSESWTRLKNRARQESLTPSGIALAAYSEVLGLWSRSAHFTLNLPVPYRSDVHPRVSDLVGSFTSILLLEIDNRKSESFRERAQRIQAQLWNDRSNSIYSCVNLVRERITTSGGLLGFAMPIVFTGLPRKRSSDKGDKQNYWPGPLVFRGGQTPMVWIDNILQEVDGALHSYWISASELFPPGLIEDMSDTYLKLLRILADNPSSWTEPALPFHQRLVPRAHELSNISDPQLLEPREGLLHGAFLKRAKLQPDYIAVKSSDCVLTYRELAKHAAQVAQALCTAGIQTGDLVAVVMKKGWEQVAAVLGILQAGAAYVPIDCNLPAQRLIHLYEKTKISIALTQSEVKDELPWPEAVRPLCVNDLDPEEFANFEEEDTVTPKDLAYVIFTSGSTGEPKGVMIDHRSAVNTINDINHRFSVGSQDNVLALSSLSFDLSVYDIFGTLAAGGTIVIPEENIAQNPSLLHQIMNLERVTIWNSVPAIMNLYIEYLELQHLNIPESLRLALLSGDWIAPTLPNRIKEKSPDTRVVSLGGATEASIWSIIHEIKTDNEWSKSIPYGKPLANQFFYVLNELLLPCPVWVVGDLYIGGSGLAHGYWADKAKSESSFITNPNTHQRLYRTGDLGRFLPDGTIEFLGREDSQVKIQGYRVELGEIEHSIATHPSVEEVVVSALGDRYADKRLVAYVTSKRDAQFDTLEVKEYASNRLPAYLVPSIFVEIEYFPLTVNGKVDRGALPNPFELQQENVEFRQHAKRTAQRATQIIEEILNLKNIDPSANWLKLGATSVDMVRIGNHIEAEFKCRVPIDTLYSHPTAVDLANTLDSLQQFDTRIQRSPEKNPDDIYHQIVSNFEPIMDPADRVRFKSSRANLRSNAPNQRRVVLPASEDEALEKSINRRSHRSFSDEPLSLRSFGQFIECLKQVALNAEPKYGYASAGSLYPIRTYLFVKADSILGLEEGFYYYDPADHQLICVSNKGSVPEHSYDLLINRPIFDSAAFAIFLVVKLGAIAPIYAEQSQHFATLEAGAMSHALECSASINGIGLCQIGWLDFESFRCLLHLDEDEVLVHSLLGGKLPNVEQKWTGLHQISSELLKNKSDFEEGDL
ncbi:MAG: amino acid adenylation domain-containing protein [Arenicellales bacterium]